jgi:hypothetical protein
MPRVKVAMGLIGNGRERERAFARRKDGLVKKAKELSILCDVGVAVVCAGPGGGAPAVWESKDGVIRKYCTLPPEKRAEHTHLSHANGELGKEKTKLARVRQGGPLALQQWSEALNRMTPEELLGSIDAALLATEERWKALGLPEDDVANGDELQRIASDALAPCSVDSFDFEGMDGWVEELMWQWDGAQPMATPNANQMQPAPGVQVLQYTNGGSLPVHQHLQYTNDGNQNLQLQMPCSGNTNLGQFAWDAYQSNATAHPGPVYGHQFTDGNYVDMNCSQQMQVPSNANAQHNDWLSLGMWGADVSSCHAFAPGSAAYTPTEHCTGGNFSGAPGIDMDGNFMDANGNEYNTQCLAVTDGLQYTSQDFGLHYLSDLADGVHFSP